MAQAYILKGTENEYLVVIKTKDEKIIRKMIDELSSSKAVLIKELATELEKSLNNDDNRRDTGKARSKNKGKSTVSDENRRRKTKDSKHRSEPSA
jgi:hypothetical protein